MTLGDPQRVVERYLGEVLTGAGPGDSGDVIGIEVIRQKASTFRAAFPDLTITTHQVVVEGQFVAVHLTGRGTHRGIFQGLPATGRSWTASCTALYRVEDGKVIDFWENWDLLSILEQLGGLRRQATASA
jgi:predicted ester cyclase